VSLSHLPAEELTAIVQYSSGDRDIVVQSATTLRFDEDDWDVPQTVTLHAKADDDVEEDTTQFLVSANAPAEVEQNHPMEPACLCLDAACYERESPRVFLPT
jgi:hypothetical protein